MNKPEMCMHDGCSRLATHAIDLHARNNPNHAPSVARLAVACEEHAKEATWEKFIGENFWKTIVDSHIERGYAAPSKLHSRLVVVDIRPQSHGYTVEPS